MGQPGRWLMLLTAWLLVGCSSTPIMDEAPGWSGRSVWPVLNVGHRGSDQSARDERDCVQQFQQASYERAPKGRRSLRPDVLVRGTWQAR